MKTVETSIPGCREIFPDASEDARGSFVKIFHEPSFAAAGLEISFPEEFYSWSNKGVLRGLHFQTPPHDHAKLVTCLSGAALDAVVDLRVGSPAYGKFHSVELSAAKRNMLYIPPGLAHGFYALNEKTLLLYKTSAIHAPEHDGGIRWNSTGMTWPSSSPTISPRDAKFPALVEFKSPFVFKQKSSPCR